MMMINWSLSYNHHYTIKTLFGLISNRFSTSAYFATFRYTYIH